VRRGSLADGGAQAGFDQGLDIVGPDLLKKIGRLAGIQVTPAGSSGAGVSDGREGIGVREKAGPIVLEGAVPGASSKDSPAARALSASATMLRLLGSFTLT
jgi:hypothetical protein